MADFYDENAIWELENETALADLREMEALNPFDNTLPSFRDFSPNVQKRLSFGDSADPDIMDQPVDGSTSSMAADREAQEHAALIQQLKKRSFRSMAASSAELADPSISLSEPLDEYVHDMDSVGRLVRQSHGDSSLPSELQGAAKRPRVDAGGADAAHLLDYAMEDPYPFNDISDDEDGPGVNPPHEQPAQRPARQQQQQQQQKQQKQQQLLLTTRNPFANSKASLTKRPPESGDCLSVRDNAGNLWYVGLSGAHVGATTKKTTPRGRFSSDGNVPGLLEVPVKELMRKIETQSLLTAMHESDDILVNESAGTDVKTEAPLAKQRSGAKGSRVGDLWVDRYAPKKYSDLISDPGTNRELLSWLRQWDECVFGRKPPASVASQLLPFVPKPAFRPESGKYVRGHFDSRPAKGPFQPERAETDASGGARPMSGVDIGGYSDPFNRPYYKTILMTGAPGLGKTTLAHIVAKHAGYNAVEINASDDRSEEIFRNRVRTATEMQSVLSGSGKPNCLIIDEIDGASVAAVNALISIVTAGESKDTKGKSKRGKSSKALMRPIICICNDPYAKSLRLLRQVAKVLIFPSTSTPRLTARLQQICRQERLPVDTRMLVSLCEITNNDIRSCVNTLQFISRQSAPISASMFSNLSIGKKDTQKSLFSLWQCIFHTKAFQELSESHQYSQPDMRSKTAKKMPSFLATVVPMIVGNGEYDKIVHGCFENYLGVRFVDPVMSKTSAVLDWLAFYDTLDVYISKQQKFFLMPFLSYTPAAFHFYSCSQQRPFLRYPTQFSEFLQSHTKHSNVLNATIESCTPALRAYLQPQTLVLDLLSPFMDCIHPAIRPVTIQLLNPAEKKIVQNVVQILLSLNLSFEQIKEANDQYDYRISPDIQSLVTFSEPTSSRRTVPYATKQLLATQTEIERVRRAEGADASHTTPSNPILTEATPRKAAPPKMETLLGTKVSSPARKWQPVKDFFGRIITVPEDNPVEGMVPVCKMLSGPSPEFFTAVPTNNLPSDGPVDASASKKPAPALNAKSAFSFKFHEGFSNAVRRSVKVRELL